MSLLCHHRSMIQITAFWGNFSFCGWGGFVVWFSFYFYYFFPVFFPWRTVCIGCVSVQAKKKWTLCFPGDSVVRYLKLSLGNITYFYSPVSFCIFFFYFFFWLRSHKRIINDFFNGSLRLLVHQQFFCLSLWHSLDNLKISARATILI